MGRLRRLVVNIVAAEPLFLLAALPFLVVLPLRLAPVGLGIMAVAWLVRSGHAVCHSLAGGHLAGAGLSGGGPLDLE
jgi:hypothetical protein